MDLSKYPLDRLVYFIAGIIPGLVALSIYALATPGSFYWFFALGFLGYNAKLALILLVAFVIGNSLTTFLASLLGAIGGVYGGFELRRPYKSPHTYVSAPWRDLRWRTALKNHLGADAPKDTLLLTEDFLQLRRKKVGQMEESDQALALANLDVEKIDSEIDDANWSHWYDHYHRVVLLDPDRRDFQWHVHQGLLFNLETAGLYVLISAIFVQRIRHWWCILPSCLWALILFAREYSGIEEVSNKWTSLSEQTEYLMAQEPITKLSAQSKLRPQ